MSDVSGIYKHYEGTDAQCSGIQLTRELTWATNVDSSGAFRYLDSSSGVHYIYPDGGKFFKPDSLSGVYFYGPSGELDCIRHNKTNTWSVANNDFHQETISGNVYIGQFFIRDGYYESHNMIGIEITLPNGELGSQYNEFFYRGRNEAAGLYKNFRVITTPGGDNGGCLHVKTPNGGQNGVHMYAWGYTDQTGWDSGNLPSDKFSTLRIFGLPLYLQSYSGQYLCIDNTDNFIKFTEDNSSNGISIGSYLENIDIRANVSGVEIYGNTGVTLGTISGSMSVASGGILYAQTNKRVACGGGVTGTGVVPTGYVSLEINGVSYNLLYA